MPGDADYGRIIAFDALPGRMLADPLFYAVAIPAVVLLGLGKGGFIGVGTISLPLMALAISPIAAAFILLPILIVQDVVGVWAFRRTWSAAVLKVMLPGAAAGIFLGYAFAAQVSTDAVLAAVGVLSVLFAVQRLWVERGGRITAPSNQSGWVGALFGAAAGFTSQIAHAGGPPYQMWVMPQRLERDVFVGTTALFFAAINWLKVPAYVALGQFTRENLLATAVLLPVAVLSTLAGVRLVRTVSPERFNLLIYLLMLPVGIKLIWDAT